MLRLCFFDGNGFDYVQGLVQKHHHGAAFVLMVFVCTQVFVLLNGLVGIFGAAFNEATSAGASRRVDDVLEELRAVRAEVTAMRRTLETRARE
jgi:hypothetical protein